MTQEPSNRNCVPGESSRWIAGLVLVLGAAVLVLFRLHAFALPLETDEANYAYIGARLLEGARLYVDVWDHQPFGVFVLFAGAIHFFGDAPEVFRWLAMGSSLLSLALIFVLLRRVSGTGTGVVGVLLFAMVSSDPGTAGEGSNREIYMNTLILAGWYLGSGHRGRSALVGAGAALALASSIKTVVAVHWLGLLACVVWSSMRQRETRAVLRDVALLSAAPLVLWVGSGVYFWLDGRLGAFVDAVFLFNLGYSESGSGALSRVSTFFAPPINPFNSALPLWIGGAVGTLWLLGRALAATLRERTTDTTVDQTAPFVVLVLASFLAVLLPGRFWPHYYYLLIPPLVLVVSITLVQVAEGLVARFADARSYARFGVLVLAFALIGGATLGTEYRDYLSQEPLGITFHRYKTRDFLGRAQGERINRVTDPDDTIFVYSNDASIYYYADRRCASRFTMITGISAGMPGAQERRKILITELRSAPPRLIVVLFDEKPFPEWRNFLHEFYGEPIGWDLHDTTEEPILFVLARKDQPVQSIDWRWDPSMIPASEETP